MKSFHLAIIYSMLTILLTSSSFDQTLSSTPNYQLVDRTGTNSEQDAQEQLTVAGIFGDSMVLQQQSAANIWGKAKPGEDVSIRASWHDDATVTTADPSGKWKTTIDTPEAGGPFTLTVESGEQRKSFKNILSGEVWICSGQSNMQWKLSGFGPDHFKEDVEKANHPNIRLCQFPQALAFEPQDDVRLAWSVCTPKTAYRFSAVAYFFGDKLREELDVPIGLISTNWGGSSAEAWVSPDVLNRDFPEFNVVMESYAGLIDQHGVMHPNNKNKPKGLNQRMPSVLYNQMIHPIVPFTCRGVVWYQGESNVEQPIQYRTLFPALIENWRQEWGQGDFPFYFVQIAPFRYRNNPYPTAMLREAQFQSLSVPNTGMVVTIDIGRVDNIHPKKKKPVGERLALLALAKDYGRADLVCSGPEFVGHEIEANQVRLRFKHVGSGLASRDGQALSHFTIAGKDQTFLPAKATIDGETILVVSEKVDTPVAVRFAWGNADEPNFMNKEGLPSSSFRTDDWEIEPSTSQ
jgi:sialate O-acetylesterase